jgi:hypothetical protein
MVYMTGGLITYRTTTQNGITSMGSDEWPRSFTIEKVANKHLR